MAAKLKFPITRAVGGGLIGSAVMAMWAMVVSAGSGMGFWTPAQLIAAVWVGSSAMAHVAAGIVVVGMMTHMMMGIILAIIMAAGFQIFRIAAGPTRLAWGAGYAIIVWMVNQFAVLPAIDPVMASQMPAWAFAIGHMLFGVTAAAFLLNRPPAVRRDISRGIVAG